MPTVTFAPHQVEWTGDKIRRYWDYFAANPAYAGWYFSQQAGDAVIDLVGRTLTLRGGRVLDFGCGPGFLTEKLVARGIWTQATDTSPGSIASLCRRLDGHPAFGGAVVANGLPTPLGEAAYDVVFFLETIEHLLPPEVDPILDEVHRLVRPGGHVVITTNNDEDLATDTVLCPDCGAVFHRVQHLSSWTPASLSERMRDHGFAPVLVKTTTFRPASRLSPMLDIASRLLGAKKVNLVYIGRKGP